MTRVEIDEQIDLNITNKTEPDSISTAVDGANRKAMLNYVDDKIDELPIGAKTSTSYTLTATQQVLASDFNYCGFNSGKAFLPTTTSVGKEIYVTAMAPGIEIYANEANENKLYVDMNVYIPKVTLNLYEMYRFTYVGIGNFWKAELVNSGKDLAKTNGTVEGDTNTPYQILTNNLNTVSVSGVGAIVVLPSTTEIGKEVLVFAANNANAFNVRGNQAGTSVLSAGGISSTTSSVSVAANTSYRFIHLGGGFWKVETL